ncbi:DUF3151 domain-containing protein [Micrococcales bacterium 31B]|nr:DUF3151 domain-containing protein [Micrococcales bacterium 31B]
MNLHRNLMAPEPTRLADDYPDVARILASTPHQEETARELAAQFPSAQLPWAVLAERALQGDDAISAYAFARTGYHRGLDALRKSGWRGAGPVPWEHGPNQGFLRALVALGRAAAAINETAEVTRIEAFLDECDPTARDSVTKYYP